MSSMPLLSLFSSLSVSSEVQKSVRLSQEEKKKKKKKKKKSFFFFFFQAEVEKCVYPSDKIKKRGEIGSLSHSR